MRDTEAERLQTQQATTEVRLRALHDRHLSRTTTSIKGEQGQPGPMGPMPAHRWDGTSLQFQQGPDGDTWGEAVDLKGDKGADGVTRVVSGGGGGAVVLPFSYWPTGWA